MKTRLNTIFEETNDLKAEFFASSLLETGLVPEQITFRPLGNFKRRSHNDIDAIHESEIGNFKGPVIESNRSGIYDYLPEQLFHLSSSKTGKELKKKIEDIRAEREKELKIRLFFLPLEQEFFFNKVRTEHIEQQASALDPDSLLFEELRNFWQIPSFVDDSTFRNLLAVLPRISECRADFYRSEMILSEILNVSVKIEDEYGKNLAEMPGSEIGSTTLGNDIILGGKLDSGLPELQVNIHFKTTAEFEKYFCDPTCNSLTEWLLGWLLPVEFDYKINLLIPANPIFLIADSDPGLTSRLGYSTSLAI